MNAITAASLVTAAPPAPDYSEDRAMVSQNPAPRRLTGIVVKSAEDCALHNTIEPSDLLTVDFDCHEITRDGVYLLEKVSDRGVEWRGARRFSRMPSGLWVDATGTGRWELVQSIEDVPYRIAGRVVGVYKLASGI